MNRIISLRTSESYTTNRNSGTVEMDAYLDLFASSFLEGDRRISGPVASISRWRLTYFQAYFAKTSLAGNYHFNLTHFLGLWPAHLSLEINTSN